MRRIDRLGWTVGTAFEAYGVRVGIRSNDLSCGEWVERALPSGWKPVEDDEVDILFSLRIGGETGRKGRRNFHLLYEGSELRERTFDSDELQETLESELLSTVSLHAEPFVFIHAGVVEWGGRAWVFPGRSGFGKTSLVMALVRAGATFYSDEMAVLDPDGRVLPFPRELRVRDGEKRVGISPAALGGRVGRRPIPLGAVVATRYVEGARWRPGRLTPARSLMELFDNAVAANRDPERVLSALENAVADAVGFKGRRGEAECLVDWLLTADSRRSTSAVEGWSGRGRKELPMGRAVHV